MTLDIEDTILFRLLFSNNGFAVGLSRESLEVGFPEDAIQHVPISLDELLKEHLVKKTDDNKFRLNVDRLEDIERRLKLDSVF